jgi:hypothetical protein
VVFKRLVVSALFLTLAGCGGGGGGSTAVPSGSSGSGGSSSSSSSGIQQTAVQRTLVQQSLTSTQSSSQVASYGNPSGNSTLGAVRTVLSGERRTLGSSGCVSGVIVTTASGSKSNETLVTINAYYDNACTKLFIGSFFDLFQTAPGAGTATGTATSFTLAGTVFEFDKLALTISGAGTNSGFFSLRDDVAANASSSPVANLGIGCSIAPANDTCTVAGALHLAGLNLDDAAAASVTGTVTTSSGNIVVGLTGSGTASTGALNATNIAAAGTFGWSITGGTQIDADSLSGSLSYAPSGLLTGGTLTLTDAADGGTVTASYSAATQTISGVVTQTSTGTTLATFSVNTAGTGTVTYAGGATGTISNWTVLG